MRWLIPIVALLLSACMGSPVHQAEARFDFGPPAAASIAETGVAGVDVATPTWLGGSAMQYRLLYADAARRLDYAESRWAAPPGELLKHALEQTLTTAGVGRCRLLVDLAEFVQVFDSPESSRFVLEGHASLLGTQDVLASRSFKLAPAAPTADARGGVAAASTAGKALGDELAAWVAAHASRCWAG
jgi:cholesterol transport system auxiliary component